MSDINLQVSELLQKLRENPLIRQKLRNEVVKTRIQNIANTDGDSNTINSQRELSQLTRFINSLVPDYRVTISGNGQVEVQKLPFKDRMANSIKSKGWLRGLIDGFFAPLDEKIKSWCGSMFGNGAFGRGAAEAGKVITRMVVGGLFGTLITGGNPIGGVIFAVGAGIMGIFSDEEPEEDILEAGNGGGSGGARPSSMMAAPAGGTGGTSPTGQPQLSQILESIRSRVTEIKSKSDGKNDGDKIADVEKSGIRTLIEHIKNDIEQQLPSSEQTRKQTLMEKINGLNLDEVTYGELKAKADEILGILNS